MEVKTNNSKVIFGSCNENIFAVVYDGSTDVYIRLNSNQAVYAAKCAELFMNISVPESDGMHFYSDRGTVEKLLKERGIETDDDKGLWVGWTYTKMYMINEPFPHSETIVVRRSKEDILKDIEMVVAQLQVYKPIRRK